MQLEWAQVSTELVLVSTETHTWVHRPALNPGVDPFTAPMTARGSVHTTQRLLDGAIALSQRGALAREAGPPLTLTGYTQRLVSHYYTTHWSAWQLRRAAARFHDAHCTELAQLAESLARHEQTHDLLAVRDLEALGYPSEYASRAPMDSQTTALLHYALRCLGGAHPVTLFGYGYALLRTAGAVTADYLRELQSILPPGVNATRCLRAHSAEASSSEHRDRLVGGIACLPADDRVRVIRAAFETANLMFAPGEDSRPRAPRPTPRPRPLRAPQARIDEYEQADDTTALASR